MFFGSFFCRLYSSSPPCARRLANSAALSPDSPPQTSVLSLPRPLSSAPGLRRTKWKKQFLAMLDKPEAVRIRLARFPSAAVFLRKFLHTPSTKHAHPA